MENVIKTVTVFNKTGNEKYLDVEVTKFSQLTSSGSIIADMGMFFRKKDETGIKELLAAVRNNSFGDFDVDPDALQVLRNGTCPPNGPVICPTHSTCETLTESTIKCRCNDRYYFDGVECIESVVVTVDVTLDREFTKALNNDTSVEYEELKKNITNQLIETFKDTPNFERVEVTGFRNASIAVEFVVHYRKDPDMNQKVVVGQTLREKVIKKGKLGEYKVKGKILIQEPPPPPKDLKITKTTQKSFDIAWKKTRTDEFFTIDYIVMYKEQSDSKYQEKVVPSGILNVTLNDLKTGTLYDITVHGYNAYGRGEKIEIEEKTEEDVDECKNARLYNCGEGYDCVNTLGSYECDCNGRREGAECVKGFIRHRVQLTIKQDYTAILGNKSSQEFRNLKTRIENTMVTVFNKAGNQKYLAVEITKFSPESDIADMEVLFRQGDKTGMRELLAAVRNNSFGDFDVDRDALQVVITGTCPPNGPDICPTHSTCKTLTERTIKCPCISGYYFDGVECIELNAIPKLDSIKLYLSYITKQVVLSKRNVVVTVVVTLDRVFTKALNNDTSDELKKNITNQLTETFKSTPNFERVEVTGFRNVSLVVELRVIYRRDPDTDKKVVVGETLREKVIKEGKIGEYKVKGNIFITEPPPPPKDLKFTKITQKSIDIAWKKPAADEFFKIIGYMVIYKEQSDSKYKTQVVPSTILNVTLSDLETGTLYDITVQGYNKHGGGDKIAIKEKTKEDVDECKNATLYNCGKGYDCANTLGSYACVCHGRKVNTECVKDAIRHRVQLTIKQNYTTTLGNRASTEFKNLESRIKNAFQTVFTKAGNKKYLELEITKFSSGSIIADMDVLFRKGDETGMKELLAAVRNNSFGDFDVDPDALQVVITGACPPNGPDICPGNSTCKKLTESTIKCPCNKDFYFDGVTCIRNVVVKVEIVLKKEFTPALKNESSKEYIELKEDITNKLTETFKDTPNFERVEVTGFRNGSLVVEFRVIYRRDPDTNKKVVVGETLREKIINNEGKLGEYEIKGDIFIQEPPPPPKSLIHSKVTENRIDIRWEAPAANDFFYIFGYIVSHKEKSQLKYKTQNETSVTLNVILSKLKSNTFYDITVHGYNKEGSGDKIEISVKTKEEDSSDGVVVIIIVVIVVVLLIIVGIVVFYNIRKRTRERHLEQPMRMGKMGEPKEFYNLGHKQDEMSRGDNPQS
ncbi:uncharacterized protein LOC114528934 [Dendronephthya gigantea]|uniref:uncharacterized protein LOC114528934 n=1 Tax=Dendronephthya gigantea TaxID=151771 RepID=UPI00106AFFF4|nr:uncharacterized protein LOC114528934 [Dendronephthya gigantea]